MNVDRMKRIVQALILLTVAVYAMLLMFQTVQQSQPPQPWEPPLRRARVVPVAGTPPAALDDVFISVKTTLPNHRKRLSVVLQTWFQHAPNQTWFFTDSDDREFQKKTNGHMINTHCPKAHNRKGLSCKMSVEFDRYLESGKKWFCHMDDDNYVNVPQLLRLLGNYNPEEDWYLGKPSYTKPFKISVEEYSTHEISFWFATGGAGVCISQALALRMKPVAGMGKFLAMSDKTDDR